jgi:hypothetical protein
VAAKAFQTGDLRRCGFKDCHVFVSVEVSIDLCIRPDPYGTVGKSTMSLHMDNM